MIDFFTGQSMDVKQLFSSMADVILFGASSSGKDALQVLKNMNINVKFFCDNDPSKHGTLIDGVVVVSPDRLLQYKNDIVLISSDYSKEISSQLEGLEIKHYYWFGFCFDFDRWAGHFNSKRLRACLRRIAMAHDLFSDESSRSIFRAQIQFRYSMNPSSVIVSDFEEYFHPFVKPLPGFTIIDGGAWVGDTALVFCKELNKKCCIYSFEPEDNNFLKLKEIVRSNHLEENVFPVQMALWNSKTVLKLDLSANNSMQFQVSKNGSYQIPATNIDTFAKEEDVDINLIKMDIEGSEIEALHGAEDVIHKNNPLLQICSYHLFDDLWEIPLLIRDICPDAEIYLGHHSQHLFESIVYVRCA